MSEIFWYLHLTFVFTKKAIKGMLTYRWSFLINCISQALDYSVTFLLMWVMISAFDNMNGWNAYEVMLLYSFSLFSYGVAGTFFFNIMLNLPRQVLQGSFDDVLVKPVKVLPYLLSSSFICNYIAHITLSLLVMYICFYTLQIPVTLLLVIRIAGIIFFGSLIYGGLFLFVSGAAFWITKTDAVSDIMFFFREVSFYPISIFPKMIQAVVTVLIPYGFVNFYPLRELLGKRDTVLWEHIALLGPLVSGVFFTVACVFFIISSKQYKSSGS